MSRHGQWYQEDGSLVLVEALGTLATIPTGGMTALCVTLSLSSGSAVDQFQIQVKANPDSSDFVTLSSAGADFTTPKGIIKMASGDITALAASTTGAFILDVTGVYQVRLLAARAAAGGGSTLTYYAGGN